jgi:hypothetical protein
MAFSAVKRAGKNKKSSDDRSFFDKERLAVYYPPFCWFNKETNYEKVVFDPNVFNLLRFTLCRTFMGMLG